MNVLRLLFVRMNDWVLADAMPKSEKLLIWVIVRTQIEIDEIQIINDAFIGNRLFNGDNLCYIPGKDSNHGTRCHGIIVAVNTNGRFSFGYVKKTAHAVNKHHRGFVIGFLVVTRNTIGVQQGRKFRLNDTDTHAGSCSTFLFLLLIQYTFFLFVVQKFVFTTKVCYHIQVGCH